MSLPYGSPEDVSTIEASEEIVAAQEARAELLIDGPAPPTSSIVATMREHGVSASRAARGILGYVDLGESAEVEA
ncbi:hypothetical protein [Natrarchaeobaculum aegyptiacum]|uniref:Uncharacterized protein n=1 Tax=Natrarchaeobaculum aegyptiacum TaxID=745377 RepID=A0A2Z2I134_9EURY|nr:hypothetical protein [Natrarchaeobaculum aegyptiacum]ARS91414.1 hypothetical protein B1756_17940 [Natrarchaeobaculum aegyptiacum]